MTEPLVMQLMNQQIFEEIVTSMFKTHVEQPAGTLTELTVGKENVLRYVCLWICGKETVPKILKQHGENATFVECLNRMKPNNEDSMHPVTSFMDYSQRWTI